MKKSLLSRSMVAVASIAVGSVALAAVPASAATSSGITRDQVLTAAAGVRSAPANQNNFLGGNYGPAANRALKAMANRACAIDPDGPRVALGSVAASTAPGGSADGVVVTAQIFNLDPAAPGNGGPESLCSFGAVAPTAERSVLNGTATLTGGAASALSGDVFVTPAIFTPVSNSTPAAFPTFSATGNAVQSNTVKVTDKKTKKEKKAAKVKYDKRLKSAKKAYKKAVDKAGSSKSKKSAAKKAWTAKKKAAKAKYKYAIAGYKLVIRKTSTPFAVSAQFVLPTPPNQP
jgi:hypothetical protein